MSKEDDNIVVGDLYKKYSGIGSSHETYALVTGSYEDNGRQRIIYELYSTSPLLGEPTKNIKISKDEFLEFFIKV